MIPMSNRFVESFSRIDEKLRYLGVGILMISDESHQRENNFEIKESQFVRDRTNHYTRLLTFKSRCLVSNNTETFLSRLTSTDKVDKTTRHIPAIN